MHSILFKSIEDLYRAEIWDNDTKMGNPMATSASTSEKNVRYLCALQNCIISVPMSIVLAINADEIQDNGPGFFIPSENNETIIVGNSVLWDIIV